MSSEPSCDCGHQHFCESEVLDALDEMERLGQTHYDDSIDYIRRDAAARLAFLNRAVGVRGASQVLRRMLGLSAHPGYGQQEGES